MSKNMNGSGLIYNGVAIGEKGERLNLTDMWKVARSKHIEAGGDPSEFESKRPSQWSRLPETERRIRHLMATDNVGKSHIISRPYGATATKVSPDVPASGVFEQNTNIVIHTGHCGG